MNNVMRFRQGDRLLTRVGDIPLGVEFTTNEPIIIARGEGHDHAHVVYADEVEKLDPGSDWLQDLAVDVTISNLFVVKGNAEIRHIHESTGELTGDHSTIELPDGLYIDTPQREFNPFSQENRMAFD